MVCCFCLLNIGFHIVPQGVLYLFACSSGDTLFHHEEEKLPYTKWDGLPDDRNVF